MRFKHKPKITLIMETNNLINALQENERLNDLVSFEPFTAYFLFYFLMKCRDTQNNCVAKPTLK